MNIFTTLEFQAKAQSRACVVGTFNNESNLVSDVPKRKNCAPNMQQLR